MINGAVTAIGDHYHVSAGGLGFTVSSALLGAAVGAVLAGRVADRYGRSRAMFLAAVLFLISALGAGPVDRLGLLIVFRVIGGIGVGMASVIAPAYIAEIAPASIRGRLGSVQQLAIVLASSSRSWSTTCSRRWQEAPTMILHSAWRRGDGCSWR